MATLSKQERDKLNQAMPTLRLSVEHLHNFNEAPPPKISVFQMNFADACKAFDFLFMHTPALMRALESYNELDAKLLEAQETIAELEETLEAANRDLESYHATRFRG